MKSAMAASDEKPVDISKEDKILPVHFMTAMASGPTETVSTESTKCRPRGQSIPGLEFATAIATNKDFTLINGHCHRPKERTLSNGSITLDSKPSNTAIPEENATPLEAPVC